MALRTNLSPIPHNPRYPLFPAKLEGLRLYSSPNVPTFSIFTSLTFASGKSVAISRKTSCKPIKLGLLATNPPSAKYESKSTQ
ncbi:Uncharacterised protein [Vibrio cholerae]|nr:Uncharacterised protein [Vibrio cholerae]